MNSFIFPLATSYIVQKIFITNSQSRITVKKYKYEENDFPLVKHKGYPWKKFIFWKKINGKIYGPKYFFDPKTNQIVRSLYFFDGKIELDISWNPIMRKKHHLLWVKNNMLDGTSYFWDDKGKLIEVSEYKKGVNIKQKYLE